jgi:hypothetical protein
MNFLDKEPSALMPGDYEFDGSLCLADTLAERMILLYNPFFLPLICLASSGRVPGCWIASRNGFGPPLR